MLVSRRLGLVLGEGVLVLGDGVVPWLLVEPPWVAGAVVVVVDGGFDCAWAVEDV